MQRGNEGLGSKWSHTTTAVILLFFFFQFFIFQTFVLSLWSQQIIFSLSGEDIPLCILREEQGVAVSQALFIYLFIYI